MMTTTDVSINMTDTTIRNQRTETVRAEMNMVKIHQWRRSTNTEPEGARTFHTAIVLTTLYYFEYGHSQEYTVHLPKDILDFISRHGPGAAVVQQHTTKDGIILNEATELRYGQEYMATMWVTARKPIPQYTACALAATSGSIMAEGVVLQILNRDK